MKNKLGNFLLRLGMCLPVIQIFIIFFAGFGFFNDFFMFWYLQDGRGLFLTCAIASVLMIVGLFLASSRFNRQT